MKLMLAIPAHRQDQYAERMFSAIAALDPKPYKVLYMLDRPKVLERVNTQRIGTKYPDIEILVNRDVPDYVGRPLMVPGEPYFLAGHMRNLAIKKAKEYGCDGIVFIDGDCIPDKGLIAGHIDALGGTDEPRVSVGKRREGKWNGHDQREVMEGNRIHIFGKSSNRVTTEWYMVDSGVLWTCNFGMNMAAIDELARINGLLYGMPSTFSDDFAGSWGGEDGFIGLECFYSGIGVYTVADGDCHILHIEHERPLYKYDHHTFMNFLEWKREELIYLLKHHGIADISFVPKSVLLKKRGK